MRLRRLAAATLSVLALSSPARATAQVETPAWNDAAVNELVARAIQRRSTESVDTALQNYSAQGRGFVYFLLDAPELDRQSLVRTDQVALEVYWQAPDQIRQRIVGLRERRDLPVTRLYYYLDRMTVVQDNYGSAIVIADGDNVKDVPHPIAAGATAFYDYRLTDSLTLRLPGLEGPVRVNEVQVRPKDATVPAFVGSVFLENATGALVRMAFTFTPSAYVDPRLDYINVNLENGLWSGRYWLPYEQRLEIRRELPELDLPFGTVIRTRMRVSDYEFNRDLPEWLFAGPHPITFLPEEQRRNFPFEEPIDADLRMEGIGAPDDVDEIRREAREILREQAISGLPRGRLGIGAASDLFRYNRAEGLALGGGFGVRPSSSVTGRVHGGWAFGPGHPVLSGALGGGDDVTWSVGGHVNRMDDAGKTTPTPGLWNSLGSLLLAEDWTDPYYSSGVSATIGLPTVGPGSLTFTGSWQRQRSATRTTTYSLFGPEDGFRPVRSIDEGRRLGLAGRFAAEPFPGLGGWRVTGDAEAARLNGSAGTLDFAHLHAEIGHRLIGASSRTPELDVQLTAGALLGDVPVQELYLVGGRGTLLGFPYRGFAGDRFAGVRAVGSMDLARPWLRGRLLGSVGWTQLTGAGAPAAAGWGLSDSAGVRASAGLGVGLFYDLLRLDVARGLGAGGETQIILEVQPDFWELL